MWSKVEAKALRQQFWTALGQYMRPVPSAEGEAINWINYKTGNKAVRLRMQEEKNLLQTIISVETIDGAQQALVWNTLQAHRSLLQPAEGHHWVWQADDHTIICRKTDVHILQQAHWPQAISFFKQSLVQADAWWCHVKYFLPDTET